MNYIRIYLILFSLLFFENIFACVGTDVLVDKNNVSCFNGNDASIRILTTNISQNLPYTYSLNSGSFTSNNTFNQLTEGTYSLVIKDNNGCDFTYPDLIEITQPEELIVDIESTPFICGADAKLYANISGGIAPYIYTWNNDPTVKVDTLRNVGNGFYSLSIQDQNQCIATDTLTIQSYDVFNVIMDASATEIQIGEEVFFTSTVEFGGTNLSYQWFPDNDMECSVCSETSSRFYRNTLVRVVVHDLDNGCIASDSIQIEVDGSFSLYIPNAFSPNGDHKNEKFLIYGVGLSSALLSVYDKNGFLLYQGDGLIQGWDGTISGQPKEHGLYFYQANVTYFDGTISERKGQITLIR